jgi:hypothetical protein
MRLVAVTPPTSKSLFSRGVGPPRTDLDRFQTASQAATEQETAQIAQKDLSV